jgi:hypothetical protein
LTLIVVVGSVATRRSLSVNAVPIPVPENFTS